AVAGAAGEDAVVQAPHGETVSNGPVRTADGRGGSRGRAPNAAGSPRRAVVVRRIRGGVKRRRRRPRASRVCRRWLRWGARGAGPLCFSPAAPPDRPAPGRTALDGFGPRRYGPAALLSLS